MILGRTAVLAVLSLSLTAAGASAGGLANADGPLSAGDASASLVSAGRDSAGQAPPADSESGRRVEFVKRVLVGIAVGLTGLLAGFLWHTSPRRHMRLERSRSASVWEDDA